MEPQVVRDNLGLPLVRGSKKTPAREGQRDVITITVSSRVLGSRITCKKLHYLFEFPNFLVINSSNRACFWAPVGLLFISS